MRGKTITKRKLNGTGQWEETTVYFLDRAGSVGFVEVTKEEYDAAFPDKPIGTFLPGNWKKPVRSQSLGVLKKNIKKQMEEDKKRGVAVEYTSDGEPVFRTTQEQRAYAKAYGYRTRNCYY